MTTSTEYTNYIADINNLKTNQGKSDVQQSFAEEFESIFYKAKGSSARLNNAKEYIENLTPDELKILEQYKNLTKVIDTKSISAKGAYNFLIQNNEQYDVDGSVQVATSKMQMLVPKAMSSDIRPAYIEAVNSLEDSEKLIAMTLTFDMGKFAAQMNNTPYKPPVIDYAYLSERVDSLVNPKDEEYTSDATKVSIQKFWEAFEKSYTGDAKGTQAQGEDLKKQLIEKLENGSDSKDEKTILSSQSMIKILLDMKGTREKPLEELLKQEV